MTTQHAYTEETPQEVTCLNEIDICVTCGKPIPERARYTICPDCLEKGLHAIELIPIMREIYKVARRRFDVIPLSQLAVIREKIKTRFELEMWELEQKEKL